MNLKNIHIGNIIKELVEERLVDSFKIYDYFKISEKELIDIYNSKNLDSELLLHWSKFLKYDLFRVYSQHLLLYSSTRNSRTHITTKGKLSPYFRKNIYTKEIIDFIIELIRNKNKSINEISDLYGIPKTTLYNWIRKY